MKIFYCPEMVCDADSYSLSPLKPKVFTEWALEHYGEVVPFAPATLDQFKLAHDAKYVDGVFAGRIPNGFGSTDKAVADSLPYTTGSMVAAVRHVLTTDDKVVLSPTSGFHHAGYSDGGGYCTFNGLMVALLVAKQEGLINNALIIDGDQHWGDGTQDIIDRLGIDWVKHWTGPRTGSHWIQSRNAYIHALRELLEETHANKPDIILYQAGADIHKDDPLGGVLDCKAWLHRDNIIRDYCRGIPLVWNLAGGYRLNKDGKTVAEKLEPVIDLHRKTYRQMDILSRFSK